MKKRFLVSVGTAAMVAAFLLTSTQAQQPRFRPVQGGIPDQYIVVLTPEAAGPLGRLSRAPQLAADLVAVYGGTVRSVYNHVLGGFSVHVREGAARALSQDPRVQFVRQNAPVRMFEEQFNPPWGLDRIDQRFRPLNNRYTYTTFGTGVNVYVIDSGIATSHPDFVGRASRSRDADFVGDGRDGDDCNGHGTHVAGTVGASTYGVAKNVRLYAVRVLDCNGDGSTAALNDGVNWVRTNFSRPAVANISLGTRFGPDETVDQAVRNLIAAEVTVVVAAGNEDQDADFVSPARVAEAITVGATDITDRRAPFPGGGRSNFGAVLDLFAPGIGVVSTVPFPPGPGIATASGTSQAAPHVAGVAALYLQGNYWGAPATVANAILTPTTPGIVIEPGSLETPNRLLHWPPAPVPSLSLLEPSTFCPGGPWTITVTNGAPDSLVVLIEETFNFNIQQWVETWDADLSPPTDGAGGWSGPPFPAPGPGTYRDYAVIGGQRSNFVEYQVVPCGG